MKFDRPQAPIPRPRAAIPCDACLEHADGVCPYHARLIAAAPDLLAALKALMANEDVTGVWDCGPAAEGWQSDELQRLFFAASDAIAKAEGAAGVSPSTAQESK